MRFRVLTLEGGCIPALPFFAMLQGGFVDIAHKYNELNCLCWFILPLSTYLLKSARKFF